MIFEIEPEDDLTAFDRLPLVFVTLIDPVTKDVQQVCAESVNIIMIFKSVGYVVVDDQKAE